MKHIAFLALFALAAGAPEAAFAKGFRARAHVEKQERSSGKNIAGKCEKLKTQSKCEKYAKRYYCSWDPLFAGGSCGEGPPF